MANKQFCARISQERQDPFIGMATCAKFWLMIEYTDPWEWGAVLNNRLPDGVKTWLADIVNHYETTRTVALFIRQHMHPLQTIRCFVGVTCEEREALYQFQFERYEELLHLNFSALAAADPAYNPYLTFEPLYLICTHGKQDMCCAKFGMPIYKEAARLAGACAWHSTHMGGDNFAPNMLCLPHGVYYSRVTVPEVAAIIEADRDGRIYLPKTRGRTRYPSEVQAADYFLRKKTGATSFAAFRLLDTQRENEYTTVVRFRSNSDETVHTLTIGFKLQQIDPPPPCSCSAANISYRYEFSLLAYANGR